jgi:hypothetical protein
MSFLALTVVYFRPPFFWDAIPHHWILCLAFWGKLDTSILEDENTGKVKVKFTLEQTMEAWRRSTRTALLFL